MSTLRLVFLTSFLLLCALHEAVALITPRSVWFDASCQRQLASKRYSVQQAWNIVTSMKNAGINATQGVPDWNLYEYIFKDAKHSNAEFIKQSLEAISDVLTPSRLLANTLIYCDQDRRWVEATSADIKGYNAGRARTDDAKRVYRDKANNMNLIGKPPCLSDARQGKNVAGYTHCDDQTGKSKCSITICDSTIRKPQFSLSQIHVFFRPRDVTFGGTEIDNFILLESTILHELIHTIENNKSTTLGLKWTDIKYRWRGIRTLGTESALQNADSLTYLGFGNYIQTRPIGAGYVISPEGRITPRVS
ncbi:hypothetical protein V8F06_007883 [Rhypophila decipiens]